MPIANIIDKRKRQYCSYPITAVIEPACMNNDLPDADQYDIDEASITIDYEERPDTSLYLAVNWANTFTFPVTLYLYDFCGDDDEGPLAEALNELRALSKEASET